MMSKIEVTPDYVPKLKQYLVEQSQDLVDHKQIAAIPDWSKELNTQIVAQAKG
jgi:hypothetical protein